MEERSGLFKGVFAKYRIIDLSPEFVAFLADEEKVADLEEMQNEGQFKAEIEGFKAALSEIGSCFVKLETTAPKDMRNWVHDLCAVTLDDVFMLLKNSIVIGERVAQLYLLNNEGKSQERIQNSNLLTRFSENGTT